MGSLYCSQDTTEHIRDWPYNLRTLRRCDRLDATGKYILFFSDRFELLAVAVEEGQNGEHKMGRRGGKAQIGLKLKERDIIKWKKPPLYFQTKRITLIAKTTFQDCKRIVLYIIQFKIHWIDHRCHCRSDRVKNLQFLYLG